MSSKDWLPLRKEKDLNPQPASRFAKCQWQTICANSRTTTTTTTTSEQRDTNRQQFPDTTCLSRIATPILQNCMHWEQQLKHLEMIYRQRKLFPLDIPGGMRKCQRHIWTNFSGPIESGTILIPCTSMVGISDVVTTLDKNCNLGQY